MTNSEIIETRLSLRISKLVLSCLTDKHGVSTETFENLYALAGLIPISDVRAEVRQAILGCDAVDGRFFLPE